MPTFKEFHEEYREKGVVILAVNSTSQDSVPAVEAFINEFQLPFMILMDHAGTVSRLYGLQALPTTFFIDRFGMISRVVVGGPLSESTLRAEVDSLLAGETP
jgi:peroxiredoxin